jgi:hypothetical protein
MTPIEETNLKHDDVIWLAGIAEGEGTFDLHRGKYPRIRVSMSDRDVIGRVATLFGVHVRLTIRPQGQKAMWHAEVQGARATRIMTELLPYMGARRSAKIAEILGAATLPAGKYGAPGPRVTRPPALPL